MSKSPREKKQKDQATQGPEKPLVRDAMIEAVERLRGHSDTPSLDVELLMAHALGVAREDLLLSKLDAEAPETFEALVVRREGGEPLAYITGRRAFWTIELEVGPGVLIPRPDSETLLEAAVEHFGNEGPKTILDLGTGPGTLLLAALDQWPEATGLGVDSSKLALQFARRNAKELGFEERAGFQLTDWTKDVKGPFDLILCNPPYVEKGAKLGPGVAEWEPPEALFAGKDGLEQLRRLAPDIGPLLGKGGIACVEIGAGQAEAASKLFTEQGLKVSTRQDLGGHIRCLVLNP